MTGHIVAEHDDDVRLKRVGAFDDRLDMIERHPRIAGVEVSDRGDPELEPCRPLRRRKVVPRDAKPQDRSGETVSSGRDAYRAQSTHGLQKMTAC
jgi:hypothetical protein